MRKKNTIYCINNYCNYYIISSYITSRASSSIIPLQISNFLYSVAMKNLSIPPRFIRLINLPSEMFPFPHIQHAPIAIGLYIATILISPCSARACVASAQKKSASLSALDSHRRRLYSFGDAHRHASEDDKNTPAPGIIPSSSGGGAGGSLARPFRMARLRGRPWPPPPTAARRRPGIDVRAYVSSSLSLSCLRVRAMCTCARMSVCARRVAYGENVRWRFFFCARRRKSLRWPWTKERERECVRSSCTAYSKDSRLRTQIFCD